MVCWEFGLQLKRDWLPELEKVGAKLFVVSIGSAEGAVEFAKQVGLSPSGVFADEDAVLYKALRFVNSDYTEDGGQRGARMLSSATFDAIKSRGNGRPWSFFGLFDIPWSATNDDLEKAKEIYRPLMPAGKDALDKTLIQGGAFAFKGTEQLFGHRDSNVGVHAELEKVLAVVAA